MGGVSEAEGNAACNLQVVNYPPGGLYNPHTDYFNPFLDNAHAMDVQAGDNRWATLMIYLNTPEKGGGTSFPKATPDPITVKAKKGSALLWYSMFPDGNFDPKSQHQGNLVPEGTKWIITYFCWDHLFSS